MLCGNGLAKELAKGGIRQKNHLCKEIVDEDAKCRMVSLAQASNRGLKRFYRKRRAKSFKNTKTKDKLAKDKNIHPRHSYKFRNLSHSRGKR